MFYLALNVVDGGKGLTPSNKRSQTPGQCIEPDRDNGQSGSFLGAPVDGLQWFGDHQVAIDGDGQQVYHGGDAKQGTAESIHFTTCVAIQMFNTLDVGLEVRMM